MDESVENISKDMQDNSNILGNNNDMQVDNLKVNNSEDTLVNSLENIKYASE